MIRLQINFFSFRKSVYYGKTVLVGYCAVCIWPLRPLISFFFKNVKGRLKPLKSQQPPTTTTTSSLKNQAKIDPLATTIISLLPLCIQHTLLFLLFFYIKIISGSTSWTRWIRSRIQKMTGSGSTSSIWYVTAILGVKTIT